MKIPALTAPETILEHKLNIQLEFVFKYIDLLTPTERVTLRLDDEVNLILQRYTQKSIITGALA